LFLRRVKHSSISAPIPFPGPPENNTSVNPRIETEEEACCAKFLKLADIALHSPEQDQKKAG
jgi:hypothetical protein